jgi:ribosomal protein L44E
MFNKIIIYCRNCDKLTKKQVEQINKKSIDFVSSTKNCEYCKLTSDNRAIKNFNGFVQDV